MFMKFGPSLVGGIAFYVVAVVSLGPDTTFGLLAVHGQASLLLVYSITHSARGTFGFS